MNSDGIQTVVENLRWDIRELLMRFERTTGQVIRKMEVTIIDDVGGTASNVEIAVAVSDPAAPAGNAPACEEPEDAPIDYTWAKVAYDGYYKAAGGVSLATGDKLPEFSRLSTAIKNSWLKAAEAVVKNAILPGIPARACRALQGAQPQVASVREALDDGSR